MATYPEEGNQIDFPHDELNVRRRKRALPDRSNEETVIRTVHYRERLRERSGGAISNSRMVAHIRRWYSRMQTPGAVL